MSNKVLALMLMSLLLSGCVLTTESTTVPHANFKVQITSTAQENETLEKIDHVLSSFGFELEANDWKVWGAILEADCLAKKKTGIEI